MPRGSPFRPWRTAQRSRRSGGLSALRQLVDRPTDEAHVLRAERWIAGAMAPDRLDRPELGVRHPGRVGLAVFRGEIQIGARRHDHRDRTSGVEGKSGSVRVDLGGRRIIKKKKKSKYQYTT